MALEKKATLKVMNDYIELYLSSGDIRIADEQGMKGEFLDDKDKKELIDDMREFLILYDKANEKL